MAGAFNNDFNNDFDIGSAGAALAEQEAELSEIAEAVLHVLGLFQQQDVEGVEVGEQVLVILESVTTGEFEGWGIPI